MPRAAFRFDAPEPQLMEVNVTWWGRESYLLIGTLLLQQWKLTFSSTREFRVGRRVVRIELSTGAHDYSARVFSDGELYIEELLPEYRALLDAAKSQESSRAAIVSGVVGGALAAAILALWKIGFGQ